MLIASRSDLWEETHQTSQKLKNTFATRKPSNFRDHHQSCTEGNSQILKIATITRNTSSHLACIAKRTSAFSRALVWLVVLEIEWKIIRTSCYFYVLYVAHLPIHIFLYLQKVSVLCGSLLVYVEHSNKYGRHQ
jgi:hypothetical protein